MEVQVWSTLTIKRAATAGNREKQRKGLCKSWINSKVLGVKPKNQGTIWDGKNELLKLTQ